MDPTEVIPAPVTTIKLERIMLHIILEQILAQRDRLCILLLLGMIGLLSGLSGRRKQLVPRGVTRRGARSETLSGVVAPSGRPT